MHRKPRNTNFKACPVTFRCAQCNVKFRAYQNALHLNIFNVASMHKNMTYLVNM